MVFFSKKHIYKFSWENVIIAFWNKYPNNLQSHVRRVDIINFNFDEKNKILHTRRLFSLKYSSPKLLERIIGNNLSGFAIEESVTDFNNRNHISNGTNHSFKNIFSVQEVCSLNSCKDSLESTIYTQDMVLKLNMKKDQLNWIGKLFENAAIQSFNEKSTSGIKAMYFKIHQNMIMFNNENKIKESFYKYPKFHIKNEGSCKIFQRKTLKLLEKIKSLLFAPYTTLFDVQN